MHAPPRRPFGFSAYRTTTQELGMPIDTEDEFCREFFGCSKAEFQQAMDAMAFQEGERRRAAEREMPLAPERCPKKYDAKAELLSILRSTED